MSLFCTRTKVAPLKSLSSTRLELSGALLLITLNSKVKTSITLNGNCYYWFHSQMVLYWRMSESSFLHLYQTVFQKFSRIVWLQIGNMSIIKKIESTYPLDALNPNNYPMRQCGGMVLVRCPYRKNLGQPRVSYQWINWTYRNINKINHRVCSCTW